MRANHPNLSTTDETSSPGSPNDDRKASAMNKEMSNGAKRHSKRNRWKKMLPNDLPAVSERFGSVLFGKTVVLRCSVLDEI